MTNSFSHITGSIGTVSEKGIPEEVDVAIVGSGGAGLMAALSAAKEGARVLIVESREIVGGATGISAGAAWIPNHGFSTKQLKVEDDLDQARRYIYGQGRDQVLDHDLIETFLETGPHVARYIEEHTSFGWIRRSGRTTALTSTARPSAGPSSPARTHRRVWARPPSTCDRLSPRVWPRTRCRSGCSAAWGSTRLGWPVRHWSERCSRRGCATVSTYASKRPRSGW